MSAIGTLQQKIGQYLQRRERNRTLRLVNSLPSEIQKDIGWPGYYPDHGAGRGARFNGLYRQ
ncbi:MAG: hypothetical protein WDZ83_12980 [Rhizobiaceae bacterium]